ncbi:MAG: hypothetical protein ACK2UK_18545 [Candidatus Promineifilaceae bacterium]
MPSYSCVAQIALPCSSPDDENEALTIEELARLRGEGARWLGIDPRKWEQLRQENPKLSAYIENNTSLVEEREQHLIYQFDDN